MTEASEKLRGVTHAALADGVELRVDRRLGDEPDPQAAGIAADRPGERLVRRGRPGGVARLVAGHEVERARAVLPRAGEHAVGGEERVAQVRAARYAPAAGLEAHEPATRRWDPDRA